MQCKVCFGEVCGAEYRTEMWKVMLWCVEQCGERGRKKEYEKESETKRENLVVWKEEMRM